MSSLKRRVTIQKSAYRKFSIFQYMTDDQFQTVWDAMDCRAYEKKSVLYREESEIPGVYLVIEGIIKQGKYRHQRRPHILSLVNAGEVLGFRSLLTNELACTTTEVVKDAVVCFIPSTVFEETLKSNTSLLKYLLEKACAELDETQVLIMDLAQKNLRERTAQTLVCLGRKFELDNDQMLKIQLSREEFASVVGAVPESVSRILSEFRKDQLIEVRRSYIKLLDVPKLTRIGNICL